jgi:DNA-binding PadR family transcriptional regulator
MTLPTQSVLRALVENPSREQYGLEICANAGLQSGTTHPILANLERIGWLESRWEDANPAELGRPLRRYYRLSQDGAVLARRALARADARTTALRRRLGTAAGCIA